MKAIYEPKGKAREYAALACNVYAGCDHGCVYCYAPDALFKTREVFYKPKLRDGFLKNLDSDCSKLKTTERILLSFTCDPYQPFDVEHKITRSAIDIRTHDFVDLFKVGKLNYHPLSREIDWKKFGNDAISLLESLGKPHYIKADLRAFLK